MITIFFSLCCPLIVGPLNVSTNYHTLPKSTIIKRPHWRDNLVAEVSLSVVIDNDECMTPYNDKW